jgi:RNA polymerase sigma-70 factor (sigma-E family)
MRVDPTFEAFVRERSTALLRTAYTLTGDRGHAEDLLQVALARTARHWSRIAADPEAYVRKILFNLSQDRVRSRRRRPAESTVSTDLDAVLSVAAGDDRIADRHVMTQALSRLPISQRQVVVLRFVEDLSVDDTARLLGVSAGTVKSQTSRALTRLRELVVDHSDVHVENTGAH